MKKKLPNFRSSKMKIKHLKKMAQRLNLQDLLSVSDTQYPSSVEGCLQVSDII